MAPANRNKRPAAKRLAIALVIAVLAALAALSARVAWRGGGLALPGLSFDAGGFVAGQITGVVNGYLNPEFRFDTIEFEAPGTLRLRGVSLVGPGGLRLIEADLFAATLAEVPSPDKPIRIERLTIQNGTVRLVRDGSGGLIGFSDLVSGTPAAKGQIEERFRLSTVLALHRVDLDGVSVEYRADADAEPIRLDGIRAGLDIAQVESRGPGWYELAFASGRAPGLELEVAGMINLDDYRAEIGALTATIDAGPETVDSLPQALAALLRDHEVTGSLAATGTGDFNLRDPLAGRARLSITGQSLRAAFGEYRAPVDSLRIDTTLENASLSLERADATLHGGSINAQGAIDLAATDRPLRGAWTISGVELRDLLRSAPSDGSPPKLAGRLSSAGSVTTTLAAPRDSLAGEGSARVEDGRLVMLPGLTQLSNLVNKGSRGEDTTSNHRGTASFTLGPRGVTITKSEVVTNAMAARGTGLIGFDRSLDLRMNAGPLEKLQSMLGKLGDIVGGITDRLVKYTIKGTIENPVVGVAPLGID